MTTTAYDTHFIASDIAFTDNDGIVTLDIPFRKVKRLGEVVLGMAGCLGCMADFSQAILDFVLQKSANFQVPDSIINRRDRDFIALIYLNGSCLKLSKQINWDSIEIENITQVPTVIGSGSEYTQDIINECPNAVVTVLEAIKHDKYTDGDVKYCSIRREDVHNLEIHPMSANLKLQVAGTQAEINAANTLMSTGKTFKASTQTYHVGEPSKLPIDLGLQMLQQGLSDLRKKMNED